MLARGGNHRCFGCMGSGDAKSTRGRVAYPGPWNGGSIGDGGQSGIPGQCRSAILSPIAATRGKQLWTFPRANRRCCGPDELCHWWRAICCCSGWLGRCVDLGHGRSGRQVRPGSQISVVCWCSNLARTVHCPPCRRKWQTIPLDSALGRPPERMLRNAAAILRSLLRRLPWRCR